MNFAAARATMVDSQLRTNRVQDLALLEAFEEVPRELFVPPARRSVAYVDEDIAIADGRYLMEPMVFARLIQTAAVTSADVALDIASGSGYATAILARLAATVVALESDAALSAEAAKVFADLGIDNALTVVGPLVEGWPRQAPYDVILINGAVAEIPKAISDQLADGGRLVTVLKRKPGPGMGQAILMQRIGDVVSQRVVFDAATPVLPDFERKPGFVF